MGVIRKHLVAVFALAVVVAAVGLSVASAGASSPGRVHIGSAARLPQDAKVTGALPSSSPVQLSIALQPRDPAALQTFATAVSTPGSAQYHHYLTVSQFAGRFGATSAEITAVQHALRADGLAVEEPMSNHVTMAASGSAADVERAFATKLSRVKLASGRTAYANTVAPTIAPSIASDVQGVIGLNTVVRAQQQPVQSARKLKPAKARADIATGGPQPCSNAVDTMNAGEGYTADYIASAYDLSSFYGGGDKGAGQTVAMFELEPYNTADIASYQSCYGTSVPVTEVPVDSPPAYTAGEDDTEAALDIEQVIGLAPSAHILVYDAPNTGVGLLAEYGAIVSQDSAKVVSSSWGECEADAATGGTALVSAENSLFQEAAAQGQSVYVASGDSGSSACYQSDHSKTQLSVQDPSAQPFVTGVGANSLFTTSGSSAGFWSPGNPVDQGVWNNGLNSSTHDASATTGGISSLWKMPSYQSAAAGSVGVINGNSSGSPCQASGGYCREVPDVSADGDNATGYIVYADGAWGGVGGTSAAAPYWAAFTALANASASCHGATVGFANPALYSLASGNYGANLSDVVLASPITGATSNDPFGTSLNGNLYPVRTGYDMTTGLGSPKVTLASNLCGIRTETIRVTAPKDQLSALGHSVTLAIHAAGIGALTYSASGLPAGLAINPSTGVISGKPVQTQTKTVTVSATDADGHRGSASFKWVIRPNTFASVKSLKATGLGQGKPRISFKLSATKGGAKLKLVWISLPKGFSLSKSRTGLTVRNGKNVKFSSKRSGRKLTIMLKSGQGNVVVTLTRPKVRVSKSEAEKITKHKVKKLSFTLGARNTQGVHGTVGIRVKVS